MDTNLYDFLRAIEAQTGNPARAHVHVVEIPTAHIVWLSSFLRNPGTLIQFQSRPTGRVMRVPKEKPPISVLLDTLAPTRRPPEDDEDEVPEMEQHYALAGTAEEVFMLLTEAMMLNPTFASLVVGAGRYYTEHVPLCRKCSQRHNGRLAEDCPDVEKPRWEFKPRPL